MTVFTLQRFQVLALYSALIILVSGPGESFGVQLFSEDFEGVTLGRIVTYDTELRSREAWSATFPAGWVPDNSALPPDVLADPAIGVTEFEGWTVVDKNWWTATSDDQGRSGFINGTGKVAVADSDEHDDKGNPPPPYDVKLSTPSISLMGAAPNTVNVKFLSAWNPEGDQKATLTARYNTGANVEVLRWHSPSADPNFHPIEINETVTLPLQNPAGATSVTLDFRLFDADNNWYWAMDNLQVYTGTASNFALRAIIDRDTSNVRIVNNTGSTVSLRGYSLRSAAGAFNEANAAFLADSTANWVQLTAPNATSDLSEGHLSSANLADGSPIILGNNVWRKFYEDTSDITFQYLVAGNDNPIPGIVEFTGNLGASFPFIDLNFNGAIDPADWDTFRAGFPVSLTGLSEVQRYQLGDLNNDSLHTAIDFLLFRNEYNAAFGTGAFEALAGSQVPEPATIALLLPLTAIIGGLCLRRRPARLVCAFLIGGLALSFTAGAAVATQVGAWQFNNNLNNDHPGRTALSPFGGWTGTFVSDTIGSSSATVFSFPAMVSDTQSLQMPNQAGANGGGLQTNDWTIAMDVKFPSITGFISLWQTEQNIGANDGEFFIRGDGAIGISGQYHGLVQANTWHRVAVTLTKNPADSQVKLDKYIDGTYVGTSLSGAYPDGRHAVKAVLNLFGDEDGETAAGLINSLAYWDTVLTEADIAALGGPTAAGIPPILALNPSKLRVNLTTGQASIVGGDTSAVAINFIDITSANGVLNGAALSGLSTRKPDSVDGPDPGTTVGDSSGEFWQVLSQTNTRITEAFLLGSSSFTTARTESLGNVFNTSTPAANRDVMFQYTSTSGSIIDGVVEYFTPVGVTGDYNNNGRVDAADYVLWRKNLNQSVTLPNDSTPGTVTPTDYTVWRANFGRSASGTGAGFAAVPEPTASGLAAFALLAAVCASLRRSASAARVWRRQFQPALVRVRSFAFVTAAIVIASGAAAFAAVPPPPTLDRNYRMGDDIAEGAVNGGTVSTTFDSQGLPGMQQLIDLTAINGPKYEAISGRPDGGTGLAIRLNPTSASQGHYLSSGFGRALNDPATSISSTFQPGGTIDYSFVHDRGLQLWARPQTAAEAVIVADSLQHGVGINASGQFNMRYAGNIHNSNASVTPNTWYHLMVVRPFGGGSILYVNGNAVAAATGGYNGADTSPLVVGANSSDTAGQEGTQFRFQGLVDDLDMFVMGLNAADDYGDFIVDRDNKYVALFKPSNAADLTNDNVVNMADVNIFVTNWLYQNTVGSQVVGDLTSRMKGDFNFDGFVNLADWEILNELAPPGVGSAALALIQGVPEPSGVFLAAVATATGMAMPRTTRRRRSAGSGACLGVPG